MSCAEHTSCMKGMATAVRITVTIVVVLVVILVAAALAQDRLGLLENFTSRTLFSEAPT